MKLTEWIIHYIKFKDCMKKHIVSIEEKDNELVVTEKTDVKHYYINDTLEVLYDKLSNEKLFFVTLNTEDNVKSVLKHWNDIKDKRNLTIIFSHPKSNQSWLLHPATHHMISEDIKEGIKTLYQSIPTA